MGNGLPPAHRRDCGRMRLRVTPRVGVMPSAWCTVDGERLRADGRAQEERDATSGTVGRDEVKG